MDHVVGKKFFPVPLRGNLPQAPACLICNVQKSKLESYLMTVLPFASTHPASVHQLTHEVKARLAQDQKLHRELKQSMHSATFERGRGPEPTTAMRFDGEKYRSYFAYVMRGLVWYEWRTIVPTHYHVEMVFATDASLPLFAQFLRERPATRCERSFGGDAFQYEGNHAQGDPAFSVWRMDLYGQLYLADSTTSTVRFPYTCGMTGPPEIAAKLARFSPGEGLNAV